MFDNNISETTAYSPETIETVLERAFNDYTVINTTKKISYINTANAYDIETSSFFRSTGNGEEKCAIMYLWGLGFNGVCIVGRTWEEFENCINRTIEYLKLNTNRRLIIYVHNLSYEFQFICKRFTWEKVFSIDNRKPIYAVTTSGIELRCSYLLSGYSLAKVGEHLQKYKCDKLVGALDYKLIRHSKTPITDEEKHYQINDIKVVMCYIQERIETDGDISQIPLTKTGYVRKYCRECCFKNPGVSFKKSKKGFEYREIMNSLRLTVDEYQQLKRAFAGGFTHANPYYSGKVIENVTSFDFTSSYPTVMIAERFPMSSGQKIKLKTNEEFRKNLRLYCCLFDIKFYGLESVKVYENYLSRSRCWGLQDINPRTGESVPIIDNNGRIVQAGVVETTITEQDFVIIEQFYTWEYFEIGIFRRYERGYLPTDFVKAILKLYADKTTLKGVEGKEIEYLNGKENLNSAYGMACTDIVRDEHIFSDKWETPVAPDKEKTIEKYNNSRSRFLFYPWGVWVCAYARRNLFTGIKEFGETGDYIYCDTDSVKVTNADAHREYIEKYNRRVLEKLKRAMKFHGIDENAIQPETVKGIKKPLGVWDFDGHYTRFKTLGAKRYMVEHDGVISLTVSGLNKKIVVPYLMEKYGDNESVFNAFNDELYIPAAYTGKNTHTYIDNEISGVVVDYTGTPGSYHELSFVHLIESDYSLSLAETYAQYIKGVQLEMK